MRSLNSAIVTILLAPLILSAGCSSHSQPMAQTSAPPATDVASNPQPSVPQEMSPVGYPRPPANTSWYIPEKLAEKMGIKLYPGARILAMPQQLRKGNFYELRGFFATTDNRADVEKFYGEAFNWGTFQENAAGEASASIPGMVSRDMYLIKINTAPDGETHIQVTLIRTCEKMYPAPCD